MINESIIVEREFNATPEKIWKALTDPQEMKKWYFDFGEFKAEPGHKFSFYGGDENKQFLHLCEVKEVIPGKKISHTWAYEIDPAVTRVSFELFPAGGKTRVRLTHEGVDKFDKNNPDLKKQNFVDGWTDIISNGLREHLEKE